MAQITLNPTADFRMISSSATTNFNDGILDAGEFNGGTSIRRSVLKFDLSSIPANATFSAATLQLFDDDQGFASNVRSIHVYRMIRSGWDEATATWNTYDGSNNWGTAGAGNTTTDREASDIGNLSLATNQSGYFTINLTAASVQEWYSGAFANNGILIKMDTETDDLHQLESSSGANPPILTITYTTPEAGGYIHMSV